MALEDLLPLVCAPHGGCACVVRNDTRSEAPVTLCYSHRQGEIISRETVMSYPILFARCSVRSSSCRCRSPAEAQFPRFVAMTGDDANDCTRTDPCQTLQQAEDD